MGNIEFSAKISRFNYIFHILSDTRAPTKAQGIHEYVTHTLPHVLKKKKYLFAKKFFFKVSQSTQN